MKTESLQELATRLTETELDEIRAKMVRMDESFHSGVHLTIKKMAAYLLRRHPELSLDLDESSCTKDTTYSNRIRVQGSREYTGYRLKVWKSEEDRMAHLRSGTLIDHNTTETYRQNREVATKIIYYEKTGKVWGDW